MSFSVKVEEISPITAHQYLALSIGNRNLNQDYVLSLAVAMEGGKWNETASEIVFDDSGALIDGHHRLHAVIAFNQPVRMLVKRGVTKDARGLIDTGRTRSTQDLFAMFRPDVGYVTSRKAALTCCISLMVPGRPPSIRTLDAYDSWMRQFKEGIDAAVEVSRSASGGGASPLRLGPVLGAFAFAHKTAPKKVIDFMEKIRDGVQLTAHEPAHTLRTVLYSRTARGSSSTTDRALLTRKVLQALFADLKGRSFTKAQGGNEGLEYFRRAYDGQAINRLVNLWTPDSAVIES